MTTHTGTGARAEPSLDILTTSGDRWLVLSARTFWAAHSLAPWDALRWTAASPGSAKLTISPAAPTIVLRADVPADEGIDVPARAREARKGMIRLAENAATVAMAASCENSGDNAEAPHYDAGNRAEGGDRVGPLDLRALATEAGWSFVERASGRVAVDLAVPGRFYEAIVEPRQAGGCRARVELARQDDMTDETRTAVAVLLLTVADAVRFVRAGAEWLDATATVFLEVDVESAVTTSELHHALSSLSVACRIAGREVKSLVDADVARSYLAARGWAVSHQG